MPPSPLLPQLPGIPEAFYTYELREILRLGERRVIRRLLGLSPAPTDPKVSDPQASLFDEFCRAADAILSRNASLPDGDAAALRRTRIRDEAQRWRKELIALRTSIQPGNTANHALFNAMGYELEQAGWTRREKLHAELDLLEDALDAVLTPLAAVKGQQGQTQFARKETIAELELLFDGFIENNCSRPGAAEDDLIDDRDEFVGLALEAAGIKLTEKYKDS